MPSPISTYHVLQFDDRVTALAFANKIAAFTATPEGIHYLSDPTRTVIWARGIMATNEAVLFVSDAVLRIAAEAGLPYHATGTIARAALPEGRVLVLGDQSDW
jgi:hypothetical protein